MFAGAALRIRRQRNSATHLVYALEIPDLRHTGWYPPQRTEALERKGAV
jgi:hypothetical protein